MLQASRRITAEAPDELTLWAHPFRFPPMPELPELLRTLDEAAVDRLVDAAGAGTELPLAVVQHRIRPGLWSATSSG